VVPKHRRSEIEPLLASVGAPVNAAEYWPEAVGYGQAAATAGPTAVHAKVGPAGNGYPTSNGYDGGAAESGWAAAPEGHSWQDWQDYWGPPPELHPDHPSAPVPRVQVTADHPSGPMSAADPAGPDWRETTGYQRQPGPAPGEAVGYQRQPGPARGDLSGYQRQTGPGWQVITDYRGETGPVGPGPGPVTGQFQNSSSPNRDSLWTAGQVLTLADVQAAQIAQQAQDHAAAIREVAEREAAAITQQATNRADAITQQATGQAAATREAAERAAAEMRAWLASMSGELGRVAAYVTESLAAPAVPATTPALPAARPAVPATRSALPATRPARPDTRPGTKPARPARPRTTPTKKPQKRPRQHQAMRIATCATAALFLFAAITGATEVGLQGFKFFVFRAGGVGQTAGTETDQQFLARQAAAAHHVVVPKGCHHRKSHAVEVHNKSRCTTK
jgi:hypothetical protein